MGRLRRSRIISCQVAGATNVPTVYETGDKDQPVAFSEKSKLLECYIGSNTFCVEASDYDDPKNALNFQYCSADQVIR